MSNIVVNIDNIFVNNCKNVVYIVNCVTNCNYNVNIVIKNL